MKLSATLKTKLRSHHRDSPTSTASQPTPKPNKPPKTPPLPTPPIPTPPPVIQAARIATLDLDRQCILERSRLVSAAPARMPYIGFYGKYNKRWYVDIVALPHNSIRTFISEVFGLLNSVYRLSLDMTHDDFEKVFYFLGQFQQYTKAVLESEEKVLYPEVDAALKKRPGWAENILNPTLRAQRKQSIVVLLNSLTSEQTQRKPSVTIATSLQDTVDEISLQMFDYFSNKESQIPRVLVKAFRGAKEKNRLEAKMISYFDSLKKRFYYTALLALPLHSAEVRADFEERHFNKTERANFERAARKMKESVMAIPKAFDEAARNYEGRFSMAAFLEHYGKDRDGDATTQFV